MASLFYEPIDFANYPAAWKDRWDFLRYFIDCWYAPILPTDGYSLRAMQHLEQQLGGQLPEAIRTVAQYCGCRRDIWQFLTNMTTLLQRMQRRENVIVVDCVEPLHAFQLDEHSSDPDLYCWSSRNNRLGDFAGKLSDLLFTTIVNNIWNGKGRERIPHFTKCVRIEPQNLSIGPKGQWLQKEELANCMMRSPEFLVHSVSYHARDLVVETRYPNSFVVAARTTSALEILPKWLQKMLADDADILTAYDFYRHQGINKPFEPSESEQP